MSLRRLAMVSRVSLWVVVAGTIVVSAPVQADEPLRAPLAKIAKSVASVLQGRGTTVVSIGEFTGPPALGSSAGPGIRKILTDELKKLGVEEKRIGAPVGIQGKYVVISQASQPGSDYKDPARLRIEASLVDQNGEVLSSLNTNANVNPDDFDAPPPVEGGKVGIDIFGDAKDPNGAGILASTIGATVNLVPATPSEEEGISIPSGDDVVDSLTKPTAYVHNGVAVAASRESPFFVEIIVDGQPQPITLQEGHPFVDLRKGDAFQVRLTSRANFETAAVVELDGVNSFAFSEMRNAAGNPRYTRWILAPRKQLTLKGWHQNNEYVQKFLITDFANSAAAKIGSTSGIGTITATFRATWKQGADPPPGEPMTYAATYDTGVGFGERDEQRVREDRELREYGIPRAVVTIRYQKPE